MSVGTLALMRFYEGYSGTSIECLYLTAQKLNHSAGGHVVCRWRQ